MTAPPHVVRHDGDDPYLVVAADKGTATFSDIANGIAEEYDFWLGDAFASGGSVGYDHKAMGITARSAWESVKRHFRELGTDTQSSDFTVVGVGDMSGDVFGNGMLLSPHIRLVGAFDHRHVFIDPDPDPAASFAERRRLFELPRSSWDDYDRSLISEGGGVWPRTAKSITVSAAAQKALGIEADRLTPAELIRALLRAPVDLLWNGGIGTYVKATSESNGDVGDKANDAVRVDARELRCRVVGEGGNLGFTQRGRIEYALAGGSINTDAIDNAGGVNCSDHEVNIKILLDAVIADGDLTRKQRNRLLADMTGAVAERVLRGSYLQTQALSLARAQAPAMLDVHDRMMRALDQSGRLDRELEVLPEGDAITDRRAAHAGLAQPELAVLLAYSKITLYAELLDSDLPEDPALAGELAGYFPDPLPKRFARPARAPPAAARDRRHARDQRHRRPRRHHLRVPPPGGHRCERGRHRTRPTPSRGTCSACSGCGPTSRRSTCASTRRRRSRCCSRPGVWSNGPRAGCCGAGRGHWTSAPRSSASPPAPRRSASHSRGCSSPRSVMRWRRAWPSSPSAACPRTWRAASRA